jgi:nucleotide-binding universal stress UspA family protein
MGLTDWWSTGKTLCILISPLTSRWSSQRSLVARRLWIMATTPMRHVILAAVDASPAAERALDRGLRFAVRERTAQLHVVTIGTAEGDHVRLVLAPDVKLTLNEAIEELGELIAFRCRALGIRLDTLQQVTAHVLVGKPAWAITQLAADLGANLVLLGAPGRRSMHGFSYGRLADFVRQRTGVPVMTVVSTSGSREPPVPDIEPPCPACVETRRRTQGEKRWCARHSERHGPRHTYRVGSSVAAYSSGSMMHP